MHRSPTPQRPSQRIRRWIILICLALLIERLSQPDQQQPFVANLENSPSIQALPVPQAPLPPWSQVKPANHGTNPIPKGFVQTAVYEDVARLAFPTPAPVAAGLRARVLLGEMPGATGRHRYIRIEELAHIKENRLVERRVMPADHFVAYVQKGKTEQELKSALPEGFTIRKKLLGGQRYLIAFESKDADSMERASLALGTVSVFASAAPEGYIFSASIPNDPLFEQQWGLHNTGQTVNGITGTPDADIDAPEAWDLTTGSSAVTVAVIDSGIDLTHEDLVDNIWTNPGESGGGKETNGIDDDGNGLIDDVHGWDFVNDDNVPQDDFGHGTHVAGIIGAKGNNGVGVAGVCWNIGLASLKALRSNGSGLWSDVTEAIAYASQMKMPVANLSLGAYGSAPLGVQLAFEQADNVLFCCAAGNGSLVEAGNRVGDDIDQIVFMPAAFSLGHVMSIAAIKQDGQLASFSNYGHVSVDITAPGVGILSAKLNGGYELKSGTSMAAAFVSGSAVNLMVRKTRSPSEARHMLQMSVDRAIRLTDKCITEGRIWLERTAIQGSKNIRWTQLTDDIFGWHYGHVLPDGRLKLWGGEQFGSGGGSSIIDYTSVNALSLNSYFVIENDLSLSRAIPPEFGPAETNSLGFGTISDVIDIKVSSYGHTSMGGETVVAGGSKFIALLKNGTVWSAATSGGGWIGRGAPTAPASSSAQLFAPVPGLAEIIQIGMQEEHTNVVDRMFALNAEGEMFGWGTNKSGELGLGHQNPVPTPTLISGMPPVSEFFLAGGAVFCLTPTGEVWGWSLNGRLLGLNSENPVISPMPLPAWNGCDRFAYSEDSLGLLTLGFRSDGKVLSAGYMAQNGVSPVESLSSGHIGGGTGALIDLKGLVWEWGNINYRGAGVPRTGFAQIPLPLAAVEIVHNEDSNGTAPVVCLLADGRTVSWGGNNGGALASGIPSIYNQPVEIPEIFGAIRCAPQIWCFPDGSLGHLGMRKETAAGYNGFLRPIPSFESEVEWTEDGEAITNDDIILTFNPNFFNLGANGAEPPWTEVTTIPSVSHSLGNGNFVDISGNIWFASVPPENISIGVTEALGPPSAMVWDYPHQIMVILGADGRLWTAANWSGPLLGRNVTMINAGPFSKLSRTAMATFLHKTDGTIWLFSGDHLTQVNTGLSDGISFTTCVSAPGNSSYYGLKSDGTVWHWESGGVPNLPPIRFERVSDASAIWHQDVDGGQQWFVRRVDGSIWGWGDNNNGSLGAGAFSGQPTTTLNYSISTQVQNSGLGINDWLTEHFSNEELGSINISGDEADPDRDGLTNLVEYALGSDPKVPSDGDGEEPGLTCSFETVSSEALSADGQSTAAEGELHFTVKLKRRAKRPGIEYRVEFSDDMVTWTASPTRLLKVLESEKTLIFRDVEPLSVTQRRWARLVIRKGN